MANPLVAQGTLSKLRGSCTVTQSPELNVTASFLGPNMIGLRLSGDATKFLPTATGGATSPQPYQQATVTLDLLKSQSLSDTYKTRFETNTLLGDVVIRTDSATLGDYQLTNCALMNVADLSFNGEVVGFSVTIQGYYSTNSALFNAA